MIFSKNFEICEKSKFFKARCHAPLVVVIVFKRKQNPSILKIPTDTHNTYYKQRIVIIDLNILIFSQLQKCILCPCNSCSSCIPPTRYYEGTREPVTITTVAFAVISNIKCNKIRNHNDVPAIKIYFSESRRGHKFPCCIFTS